jgi:hypothetical protein
MEPVGRGHSCRGVRGRLRNLDGTYEYPLLQAGVVGVWSALIQMIPLGRQGRDGLRLFIGDGDTVIKFRNFVFRRCAIVRVLKSFLSSTYYLQGASKTDIVDPVWCS